jgi:hypothetical protein
MSPKRIPGRLQVWIDVRMTREKKRRRASDDGQG